MKLIGNLIWLIFIGIISSIVWFFVGLFLYITIIGIPFGKQCLKITRLSACPFGTYVHSNFDKHPIANVIWLIFAGWELCLVYLFSGLIFCITIIGIPFGRQCLKLAGLALFPFGAKVS